MYKILCPSCHKIIAFSKSGFIECARCGANIKVDIFESEKQIIIDGASNSDALIFYCGDEVVRAYILQEENNEKYSILTKNSIYLNKTEYKQQKTGLAQQNPNPIIKKYESDTINDIKNESEVAADIVKDKKESFLQKYIGDKQGRYEVLPAEVECEGVLISEHEIMAEQTRERRRVKHLVKNRTKKKRYIIVDLLSLVCIAMCVIMLYTHNAQGLDGVDFISLFVREAGTTVQRICGAMLIVCSILSAVQAVFAFTMWGEYSKSSLKKITLVSFPLFISSVAVITLMIADASSSNYSVLSLPFFAAILLLILSVVQLCLRLFFSKEKTINPSPKVTEKKAYITLSVACFFVYDVVLFALISQCSSIACTLIKEGKITDTLAVISQGASGMILDRISGEVLSTINTQSAIYTSIALGACLIIYVLMYVVYISRTTDIFCGKIKYNTAAGRFEEDFERKQMVRFLQRSTIPLFFTFAAVFTAELVRNILLYMHGIDTGTAVFCMLAGVGILAVRCFPYAHIAREIFMQAFYEYKYMGAEVSPMSKKQKYLILLLPLPFAIVTNAAFVLAAIF